MNRLIKDLILLKDLKERILQTGKNSIQLLKKKMRIRNNAGKIRETERKFFQIKNKYIVCPVKSGLMLIDQKSAHERVLYERFHGMSQQEQTGKPDRIISGDN